MKRAYYANRISKFLNDCNSSIIGVLSKNHSNRSLEELQINAWGRQIEILKNQLIRFDGYIYFEFAIPRMGKRVDNIVIIKDTAFIIEFKVGSSNYEKHAAEQVMDYTVDLKNFHEGSHNIKLIPVLVSTNAGAIKNDIKEVRNLVGVAKSNEDDIANTLSEFLTTHDQLIDITAWEKSIYKPTPTIIEAARALYKGHNVKEITRSDSGAINLSKTACCINNIVEISKKNDTKSICFITGVPGAGKTLAGLNIANERMNADKDEHAVFLSGNGPLVEVLREALTRDEVQTAKSERKKLTKKQSAIKANAFIQNIHYFRDDNLLSNNAPIEKVVVFDEAQRAWNKEHTSAFMKRKKGKEDFNKSEPQFLIEVMNRHNDWCILICLIGGGQEINTGEAGLQEWVSILKDHYSAWTVYYSNLIIENDNYLSQNELKSWLRSNANVDTDLHLSVSVRSFRSEKLSEFVHELLDVRKDSSVSLYQSLKKENYPIVVTRDLLKAKEWLRKQAKGSERIGLIASSGAYRLRPYGIDVKNRMSAANWFLNDKEDIRSSYFLEDVATEFYIQGLEIDWSCLAWGANFHFNHDNWKHQKFKGTKWQNINKEVDRIYLKNSYRVLLTRARQGIVIFIPNGDDLDKTRRSCFYEGTYTYLKEIGITEI